MENTHFETLFEVRFVAHGYASFTLLLNLCINATMQLRKIRIKLLR